MRNFILKSIFIITLVLTSVISLVILADPYNFYPEYNIDYNRIKLIRKDNVCLFSLNQINNFNSVERDRVEILLIGNSQSEYIRGGFQTGESGRLFEFNDELYFDLSFGGATNNEVIDLLELEYESFNNLKKVFISFNPYGSLPENRIVRSREIINNPFKNYLLNSYFFRESVKLIYNYIINKDTRITPDDMLNLLYSNDLEKPSKSIKLKLNKKLRNKVLRMKNKKTKKVIKDLNKLITDLKKNKIKVVVYIPPIHPVLYQYMIEKKNDEFLYIKKILSKKAKYYNFNEHIEDLDPIFQDAMHLKYPLGGKLLEILNNQ